MTKASSIGAQASLLASASFFDAKTPVEFFELRDNKRFFVFEANNDASRDAYTPVIKLQTLRNVAYLFNKIGSPNPSSFIRGNCVLASPTTSQIILSLFRYFADKSLICATVIDLTINSRSLT
jgi:hypothetical protein